jgi:hypothetical protein
MILNSSGDFVVLDRGKHLRGDPPTGALAEPSIAVVSEDLRHVDQYRLHQVVEPTAIVIDTLGRYIVADTKAQSVGVPDGYIPDPADLIRVDPHSGWRETSLLSGIPVNKNPLVFPTTLVFESPDILLVCDTGLRWRFNRRDPEGEDRAYRYLAESAEIYRIDLSQTPHPSITKITTTKSLVNPSKMIFNHQGNLIIADQGELLKGSSHGDWRSENNEFGVLVRFSRQHPSKIAVRNQIRRGITSMINEQRSGESLFLLDF